MGNVFSSLWQKYLTEQLEGGKVYFDLEFLWLQVIHRECVVEIFTSHNLQGPNPSKNSVEVFRIVPQIGDNTLMM